MRTRDPWFPICAWFSGSSVIVALKSGPAGDHSLLGSRTPSAWTLRAFRPTEAMPDAPLKETGNKGVVVAKLMMSQPSPYSTSPLALQEWGRPWPWPIS